MFFVTDSHTTESTIESGYNTYNTAQSGSTSPSSIPENSSTAQKRPATGNIEDQLETQVKRPALRPSTGIQATKQTSTASASGPTQVTRSKRLQDVTPCFGGPDFLGGFLGS
nr:unnamed protein product [Callosobruchus analis]